MTDVLFYLSEDGEVLSNKDHPVAKPVYVVSQVEPRRAYGCEAVSELELTESRLKLKVFKAVKLRIEPEFWKPKNGIVR